MKLGAWVQWKGGCAWMTGTVIVAAIVMIGLAADLTYAGEPTEAIRGTIDEVLRILGDKQLKEPSKANERRQILETVVGEWFD